MKQAGTSTGKFLVSSLVGNLKQSQQGFAEGATAFLAASQRETQPVVQHFTKEAGALLLFLARRGDQS